MGWAQEGFAELRSKAAKYDGKGASKDDADKIARDVKAKHPVFKELYTIDGEEDWDFQASYNPTVTEDGPDKKEIKDDKNAGQLLTPSSLSAHENLKVENRNAESSSKVGYDAQTEGGTKGIIVSSVGGNPYSRDIDDGKKEKGGEFNTLKPKSVGDRKKHIDKNQTHSNYKVTAADIDFKGTNAGQLIVNYSYTVEQEGQAPETRTFQVSIEPNDNGGVTRASGTNVGIKDPGTRGTTASANNAAINESLQQDDDNKVVFNASHLIADWFNGSGFRSSLNLVNTSEHYNKTVMAGIEKEIKDKVKAEESTLKSSSDSGEYLTFDIDVTAEWEKVGDSNIVDLLKSKLTEANGIVDDAEKNAVLQGLVDELSKKQDPKFIKQTTYEVFNGVLKNHKGQPTGKVAVDIGEYIIGEDKHIEEILN